MIANLSFIIGKASDVDNFVNRCILAYYMYYTQVLLYI